MVVIYLLTGLNLILTLGLLFFLLRRPAPKTPVPHPTGPIHISLVKFNPFPDTGGDQSFVVSLLDQGGSGILFTSLHGRGVSRAYAKRVTAGKADQELSAEEKQALSQAMHGKSP